MRERRNAFRAILFAGSLGTILFLVASALAQTPPLEATLALQAPPPNAIFAPGEPILMRLRVLNRSNAVVRTTEGFSQTEFPRQLLVTDPVGISKGTVSPIDVERYVVPTHCFVRNGVLQRPTAIPVVPIEVLSMTFGQEYVFDARTLYDLAPPGRYSVVAQVPLLSFTLADEAAIITDCDDVPGTLVHVGDEQTASVPPLSGQAFTILSNLLEFVVEALPTVTVAATTPTATEAGLVPGAFTVSRSGSTTAALTVAYSVAGTATAGSDYTALAGSVIIPVGQTTAPIAVTPLQDTLVEPDETVILTLTASAAYTLGTPSSATVTLVSDDVAGNYISGFGFPLKNDSDCAQVPCKTFRRGRPLPVRFWLFDANHTIVTNATPHIVVTQISPIPPAQPPEDLGIGPSDGGDVFRYNRLTRQYVFFLDTRGLKVGVWRIDVRLNDGTIGSVHFGLR